MFSGIKDTLTSAAAKSFLASRLDRYGKLTDLHISSRGRKISAELVLEGEENPVVIQVLRYVITGEPGSYALTIKEISASRAWLQNLLEDLLVDKSLSVPSVLLLALGKPEA